MKIRFNLKGCSAAVVLAAALLPTGAHAQTATANLAVTATVANNCTIATAPVAFGAYDPIVTHASAALTGNGSVTVTCTKGTAPAIQLGLGSNATAGARYMANAGERLAYELYHPGNNAPGAACGALTQVWGTAGAGVFSATAAPSRAARTYNVCGSVPPGQDVAAGAYSDTVVATVNF
jgi:spore coat protein U-like protein